MNQLIRDYLQAIGNAMTDQAKSMTISEEEDTYSLILTSESPYDNTMEIAEIISLKIIDENMLMALVRIGAFTDIPETLFKDVQNIITELNIGLDVGAFVLIPQLEAVDIRQSIFFDGDTPTEAATENMLRTLAVLEIELMRFGGYLDDLISGRQTLKEIENSINAEMR